jgi:hypothetical protein
MTKFMHIRQPSPKGWSPKGGITIAYQLEQKSTSALCAISFCSPKDRYDKSIGRSISRGRLSSQPLQIQADGILTCRSIAQVLRTLLVEWEVKGLFIEDNDHLPLRAQRFPVLWKAPVLSADGGLASIKVDGSNDCISGWIRNVPRWARKIGWTWI